MKSICLSHSCPSQPSSCPAELHFRVYGIASTAALFLHVFAAANPSVADAALDADPLLTRWLLPPPCCCMLSLPLTRQLLPLHVVASTDSLIAAAVQLVDTDDSSVNDAARYRCR